MIIRENYLNTLIDAKDTEFIKVITGVRRCGKSGNIFCINFKYVNCNKLRKND